MKRPTENLNSLIRGADALSLGISMVVAVGIGFGLSYYLHKFTGSLILFWFGIFVGISAAVLNVYKYYKIQQRELKELADDPKYAELAQSLKKQEEEKKLMRQKMSPNYQNEDDYDDFDKWDKEDIEWEQGK